MILLSALILVGIAGAVIISNINIEVDSWVSTQLEDSGWEFNSYEDYEFSSTVRQRCLFGEMCEEEGNRTVCHDKSRCFSVRFDANATEEEIESLLVAEADSVLDDLAGKLGVDAEETVKEGTVTIVEKK